MKKVIMLFAVGVLAQQLQAQGTVYLSNLGQTSTGSSATSSDSWLATDFYTGANPGGYLLDSVQLGIADAAGNPSGFTAMIYSVVFTSGPFPGTNLSTLTGSANPSTSGIYTYSPSSSLILSPNTEYFIVLNAGTKAANGAYAWQWTYPSASYNPIDDWDGGGYEFTSSSGLLGSWGRSGEYYPQYAISAESIPEPSVLGLLGISRLVFFCHRRNVKAW